MSGAHIGVLVASAVFVPVLAAAGLWIARLRRAVRAQTWTADALRASESRYRELVENANDAVFTVDRGGYCRSMNRAGRFMSGCDSADPRGVHIDRLLDRDQAALAQAQLRRVLGGEPVAPFELTLVNGSGAQVTVELALHVIAGDGPPEAAQGIARDVTLRKELEMQVLQSQKMQAIGQLAAGVAHDFNNLMTVVLGNCDEAHALIDAGHAARNPIEEIGLAAERAASLTAQLLAFSRRQLVQPRVLRIDRVIADTERLLARLVGEHVTVLVQGDQAPGHIRIDPGQLQQILLNLSVNARDAMPHGGQLTLEARTVRLDEALRGEHGLVPAGAYVRLAVTDTGVGMDASTRARLFEPFFTTKDVGKGTGLGLSTVYGIAQQNGAFITVESQPGRGSTFAVYFPCAADAAAAAAPVQRARASCAGGELVLLVEDERAVRDLVSRHLCAQGYDVLAAHNAAEAAALCRTRTAPPALLITDVVMPGMNGPALADLLRRSYANLKVLFLSGYADEAVLRQGVLPSGTHFQQKPFALDALVRKVRDILDATAPPMDRTS